jgi:hypothetical protein
MINRSGHPTGDLVIPKEETIMLKTISAALLMFSVVAAPALAASQSTKAQAPVIKTEQVKKAKASSLNANAKMGRHHAKHARHHSKKLKVHKAAKATVKHAAQTSKRV